MKFMKLTFCLTALALGMASAAESHNVDLKKSVTIGSTQLEPGRYKVEMQGDKAVFRTGKNVVEVPATFGKRGRLYSESKTFGGMSHCGGTFCGYSPKVI